MLVLHRLYFLPQKRHFGHAEEERKKITSSWSRVLGLLGNFALLLPLFPFHRQEFFAVITDVVEEKQGSFLLLAFG